MKPIKATFVLVLIAVGVWAAGPLAIVSSVAAAVSSVFGRTGAVTAQSGDYTCAQTTNCVVTVPNQWSVSSNAVTFPALPNSYTANVNSPYVQNAGIRKTAMTMAVATGGAANIGMSVTTAGSGVWDVPTATAPGLEHIVVVNGSAVGIVETAVAHRTGRTNGMSVECMGAVTTILVIRAIPCGLTSSTFAQALGLDVPGSFNMVYIVMSTTGVYTSGTDTTHYMLCVVNGTTQTCSSTGLAFDALVHRFRIFEDLTNSQWTALVDGAHSVSIASSSGPASGTNLAAVAGAQGLTAGIAGNWQFAYLQLIEDWK